MVKSVLNGYIQAMKAASYYTYHPVTIAKRNCRGRLRATKLAWGGLVALNARLRTQIMVRNLSVEFGYSPIRGLLTVYSPIRGNDFYATRAAICVSLKVNVGTQSASNKRNPDARISFPPIWQISLMLEGRQ